MAKNLIFVYAKNPKILKTSIKTALVVGTILAIINHYDHILALDFGKTQIIKIIITYFVPFCVATYAASKHAQRTHELDK